MGHTLKKKQQKVRASFAVIVDMRVKKPLTEKEAVEVCNWLEQHLEMPDNAYETEPVDLIWDKKMKQCPIKFRVIEYFI